MLAIFTSEIHSRCEAVSHQSEHSIFHLFPRSVLCLSLSLGEMAIVRIQAGTQLDGRESRSRKDGAKWIEYRSAKDKIVSRRYYRFSLVPYSLPRLCERVTWKWSRVYNKKCVYDCYPRMPVGEYQRERAGYKINVNTGSEACLYMLYGISCCTRVAFRIRAGGKASRCARVCKRCTGKI